MGIFPAILWENHGAPIQTQKILSTSSNFLLWHPLLLQPGGHGARCLSSSASHQIPLSTPAADSLLTDSQLATAGVAVSDTQTASQSASWPRGALPLSDPLSPKQRATSEPCISSRFEKDRANSPPSVFSTWDSSSSLVMSLSPVSSYLRGRTGWLRASLSSQQPLPLLNLKGSPDLGTPAPHKPLHVLPWALGLLLHPHVTRPGIP